jgi:hypothetical protein
MIWDTLAEWDAPLAGSVNKLTPTTGNAYKQQKYLYTDT